MTRSNDILKPLGFTGRNSDATIAAIVEQVIGLPVGHSRHDALVAGLTEHYTQARATLVPGQAMQSTVALACTTPDFFAIGL
jgi:hypothetical protein